VLLLTVNSNIVFYFSIPSTASTIYLTPYKTIIKLIIGSPTADTLITKTLIIYDLFAAILMFE